MWVGWWVEGRGGEAMSSGCTEEGWLPGACATLCGVLLLVLSHTHITASRPPVPHPAPCRLGQTKPVTVYRLITEGSVDKNIYDLSQRKLKLDAGDLGGGRGTGREGCERCTVWKAMRMDSEGHPDPGPSNS